MTSVTDRLFVETLDASAVRPRDAMRAAGFTVGEPQRVLVKQRTPEWHTERASCDFTASRAAEYAGMNTYTGPLGPLHYVRTLRANPSALQGDIEENVFMRHGNVFEPWIRHDQRRAFGARARIVEGGFFKVTVDRPEWGAGGGMLLGASPDVEYTHPATGALMAIGEIKAPRVQYWGDAFALPHQGWLLAYKECVDGLPVKVDYLYQMTQQMLGANCGLCIHVCHCTYTRSQSAVVLRFSPTLAANLLDNAHAYRAYVRGDRDIEADTAAHPAYVMPSPDWARVAAEMHAQPLWDFLGEPPVTGDRARSASMPDWLVDEAVAHPRSILYIPVVGEQAYPMHTDPQLHVRARAILALEESAALFFEHANLERRIHDVGSVFDGADLLAADPV